MAIQPIDLQTLFTQIDKVGKAQASQKEGLQLQQNIQSIQIQQRTEERIQSVNESQDTGDGASAVNERSPRRRKEKEEEEREAKAGGEPAEEEAGPRVIRDPALGKIIDVSG